MIENSDDWYEMIINLPYYQSYRLTGDDKQMLNSIVHMFLAFHEIQ